MFESSLQETFQKIFGVKKVTFEAMNISSAQDAVKEQETLFVEVQTPHIKIFDRLQTARVTGRGIMVGNSEKLTYGFFAKAIARATNDLTKDLFFYQTEANRNLHGNIVMREFSFVYFFRSQYDPATGSMEISKPTSRSSRWLTFCLIIS